MEEEEIVGTRSDDGTGEKRWMGEREGGEREGGRRREGKEGVGRIG